MRAREGLKIRDGSSVSKFVHSITHFLHFREGERGELLSRLCNPIQAIDI